MKRHIYMLGILGALPLVSHAQFDGIRDYVDSAIDIVNMLIVLSVAVAILVFFWGLAMFILNGASEKSHESGRNLMIWGTIALFVMASIGGLVWFIQDQLGIYSGCIDIINLGGEC